MDIVDKIKHITIEIQQQYLQDDTPWIVGYSGGKDSTAVLQLLMYALMKLPKEKLQKPIHVLTNDTLVENPNVVGYVDSQLALIERAGKSQLFSHSPDNFRVVKVVPKIQDRFWINLIGKGYPSPTRNFRWCTDRLKISPTNDYILQQVSQHGKAIIVLGTRKAESTNRAKSMERYDLQDITGAKLRKHTLPNAWVYAPISELDNKEVWQYLQSVPSFWQGDNRKLVVLYKNASDNSAECPLVIDTSTPSCGTSRFGCWVCTVVNRDKSMENLIDNGEEWMEPLLDLRNILAEYREDATKRVEKSRIYADRLGPFTFKIRAELLEKLLKAENATQLDLITKSELAAIQLQWNYDGNFEYSVADIYFKVKNKRIMLDEKTLQQKEQEEFELLKIAAEKHGVNADHIRQLMIVESEFSVSLGRRHNIHNNLQQKIAQFVEEIN
ncbi:MAG TPA: DNA phosphorothioation system sulfurtransferase DndC [Chitinophagales bacterium]|nr:DNA phosphorothioation system sulfurtransferase DndC [Chitinophagales bacterium]